MLAVALGQNQHAPAHHEDIGVDDPVCTRAAAAAASIRARAATVVSIVVVVGVDASTRNCAICPFPILGFEGVAG